MLVGVSGYAQSGKDTVAGILVKKGFVRAGFAEALREFAYAANPIVEVLVDRRGLHYAELVDTVGYEEAKKLPEVRNFLQRVGTEAGRRVLGENIWVDTAMNRLDPDKSYVFTDVRFPNEAVAIRDRGGVIWRVKRPARGPVNSHPSETALDDFKFDAMLYNGGTLGELEHAVSRLLAEAQYR